MKKLLLDYDFYFWFTALFLVSILVCTGMLVRARQVGDYGDMARRILWMVFGIGTVVGVATFFMGSGNFVNAMFGMQGSTVAITSVLGMLMLGLTGEQD